MIDNDVKTLLNQILENGDVKIYSDDGELIELHSHDDNAPEIDEANNYIKAVEQDFRENADTILERLELSHLYVTSIKEK